VTLLEKKRNKIDLMANVKEEFIGLSPNSKAVWSLHYPILTVRGFHHTPDNVSYLSYFSPGGMAGSHGGLCKGQSYK